MSINKCIKKLAIIFDEKIRYISYGNQLTTGSSSFNVKYRSMYV